MYKLIITAENGIYLMGGIGNDELRLKKYGENWIESHGYRVIKTEIDISGIAPENKIPGCTISVNYA